MSTGPLIGSNVESGRHNTLHATLLKAEHVPSGTIDIRFSSMQIVLIDAKPSVRKQIVRPTNHRRSSRRMAPSSRRSTGYTRNQAQSTSRSCVRPRTACSRGEARISGFFSIYCSSRHGNAVARVADGLEGCDGVRAVHLQPTDSDGIAMCEGLTQCCAPRTCLCGMCCSRTRRLYLVSAMQ